MKPNRRDVIRFVSGGAAGLFLTPVPYKVLDDVAIWTQNWSWIPRLPRGEISEKFTSCTLCPSGCGVRVKCVGGQPYAMSGIQGHPSGRGALCATGVAGHHLAWHPARVRGVMHGGKAGTLEDALNALRRAKGTVALLDARPERAVSELYRKLAASLTSGEYVTVEAPESGMLEAVARLAQQPDAVFGVDFENAKTLLTIDAPVLEAWGTPARLWAVRDKVKLTHVSARYTPTAAQADAWLPIRPGAEAALVLSLAHVAIREKLYPKAVTPVDLESFHNLVANFPPSTAEGITGIPAARIVQLAHELAKGAPSVVIAGGDAASGPLGAEEEMAAAALNILIGSVGRPGGLLARRELAPPKNKLVTELADQSVGALIIDAAEGGPATPWDIVRRKLAADAVVVCLAGFHVGYARHADFVVPATAYLERTEAAGTPCDATAATFSVSAALRPAPEFAISHESFVAKLAEAFGVEAPGTVEEILHERAARIHAAGRGEVLSYADGSAKPMSEFESPDALLAGLKQGACWRDEDPLPQTLRRCSLLGGDATSAERLRQTAGGRFKASESMPLAMLPFADASATGADALSPLLTKLYQESGLRAESNLVLVNPETGQARDLEDGCLAELRTSCGACRVRVHFAPSVMPDVLEAAVGPSRAELAGDAGGPSPRVIDVCVSSGPWRVMPADLVRV